MEYCNNCANWAKGDDDLVKYHNQEWCKESHDERYLFEMLCLEGASVGLSWKIIIKKRNAYKKAFHNFDIEKCSKLTDAELDDILQNFDIVKNKSKVYSVRTNAIAFKQIEKEFGSFDKYIWSFPNGKQIVNHASNLSQIPTKSELSIKISKDLQKRKMKYVGDIITYSYLQSIGVVDDHLDSCPFKNKCTQTTKK